MEYDTRIRCLDDAHSNLQLLSLGIGREGTSLVYETFNFLSSLSAFFSTYLLYIIRKSLLPFFFRTTVELSIAIVAPISDSPRQSNQCNLGPFL